MANATPEAIGYTTILRQPDAVLGATEATDSSFEENPRTHQCPVQWSYEPSNNGWRVVIHPSSSPVKCLKLRWHGDFSKIQSVFGDQWARADLTRVPLEWKCIIPFRPLPWFCIARDREATLCYGVKTGCDCFAFFQLDTHGITLYLNLMSGAAGTDVKESFTACVVTETACQGNESVYDTVRRFMAMLCDKPVLPKEPIFGVNNWYWAYGDISRESVLREATYLQELSHGTHHRPSLIIDDGWELNRTYFDNNFFYLGGPFKYCNDRFGDMQEVACRIAEKGIRPGLWFRPLLTLGPLPQEAQLRVFGHGVVLDPSHPYTLERLESDSATFRQWGYEVIKHDFTLSDVLGEDYSPASKRMGTMFADNKCFYDKTKTTATIIKNMYKAIQRGAGDADVIGCNVVGHLSAGIHSIQRIGEDTSGRCGEWTIRNGVHSFMRLPMNNTFFRADPDCAAFTEYVDPELNMDFLELCALTGVTTIASIVPYSLTDAQMTRINEIFHMADQNTHAYGIANYENTTIPELFTDGKNTRSFNWTRFYDGARVNLD